MNSLKAIIAGTFFIVVATLLMQLVFILIAVGYTSLAKDYPFLNEISGVFRYLIAIPVFIGSMFVGGYITSAIAKENVYLHCFVVAAITIGGMMWFALENTTLTPSGIGLNIVMWVATMLGGWYWERETRS